MADSLTNVTRVLAHYGLAEHMGEILEQRVDRIFFRPPDDAIVMFMVLNGWPMDPGAFAKLEHGTPISFREPGDIHGGLQICVHRKSSGNRFVIDKLEGDCDYFPPGIERPLSSVEHVLLELIPNAIHGKTDQRKVAKMLDERLKDAA